MGLPDSLIEYIRANTKADAAEILPLLGGLFRQRQYKKGEYFARQGDKTDKIGFAADGIFAMQILREDGTEYVKSFIRRGGFLLATFNEKEPNPVSISAICDSVVFEAAYSDIKALFRKYPELAALYRMEVEKETEFIYLRLEQAATLDSRRRYELFKEEFGDLEELIPQYLIASYLGITPTQLSRIKKALNKCK